MRKKLVFLVILMIVAIFFVLNESKKQIFVDNAKDVSLYTDKDITRVETIIADASSEQTEVKIKGVISKFAVVEKKDTQYCEKEDTTLISRQNGYNVISNESGHNFYYFKEVNGNCEPIGQIENVNFTEKIVSTYANNSIYTNFESLNDLEVSGMVRVKKDEIIPFDSPYIRHSNPTAFANGVLMIENNSNVIAFDKDDKELFRQNNEMKSRNVLAINTVDKSLFMVVEYKKKYYLEAYELANETSIKTTKPKVAYNITDFFKNIKDQSAEITTKKSKSYASFTLDGSTIIVSDDFSKLFLLSNADTALDLVGSIAVLKKDELYYVVDLSKKEREHLGNLKALNFKMNGSNIFFTIIASNNKELHIRFDLR